MPGAIWRNSEHECHRPPCGMLLLLLSCSCLLCGLACLPGVPVVLPRGLAGEHRAVRLCQLLATEAHIFLCRTLAVNR